MRNRIIFYGKFLLVPFLLFCAADLSGQEDSSYFRSNSLALPLEEISKWRSDDFEYVLQRMESDDTIEEILFQRGTELHRAVYEFKNSLKYGRHYSGGEILRETIEEDDKLLEEKIYTKDGISIRRYNWSEDSLDSVEIERPDGLVVKNTYMRGEKGELLQLIRSETSASEERSERVVSRYEGGSQDPDYSQWHVDKEGCFYFFYHRSDAEIQEKYCKGVLVYTRVESKKDGPLRITENYPEEGRSVEILQDSDGNPIEKKIQTADGRSRWIYYEYINGSLTEKREIFGNESRKTEYSYTEEAADGESRLQEEKIFENGLIVKLIRYRSEGSREVVLYRHNSPVVKLLYQGEELIGRESLLKE